MIRRYRARLAGLRTRAIGYARVVTVVVLRPLPAAVRARMIPIVRFAKGFEISARAVEAARERLAGGGNLLVFSVGRDSSTWELVNPRGRTAFLEDLPEWIGFARQQFPSREVYLVNYTTERDASMSFRALDEIPTPPLAEAVGSVSWDVVVVDGPKSYSAGQPGRASSIALAARLVGPGGMVLIDDYDRPLERHIAQVVFGRAADRVLDPHRPVGLYDN